ATAGHRATCCPTSKNVAFAPTRSRISMTAGVPSGWGPSSKVSAIPAGRLNRVWIRSRRATAGSTGATAGADHATSPPSARAEARDLIRFLRGSPLLLMEAPQRKAAQDAELESRVRLQGPACRDQRRRLLDRLAGRRHCSLERALFPNRRRWQDTLESTRRARSCPLVGARVRSVRSRAADGRETPGRSVRARSRPARSRPQRRVPLRPTRHG